MANSTKTSGSKLEILDWDYKDVKGKNRWNNKHEFELVREKLARFEELLTYRRTSCWWAPVPYSPEVSIQDILTYNEGSSKAGGGTGSNWNLRWDYMLKAYLMWKKYLEEYSNVKSPLSWGTMQAFMAQFGSANQTVSLYPNDDNDAKKIDVAEQYIRKLEMNFTEAKVQLAQSAGVLGTAISYNPFVKKVRPNDIVLDGDKADRYLAELIKSDDESDKKKYMDLKDKLSKNKPVTKEIDVIDYYNPALISCSLYEIYPDDHATEINGLNNECRDLDWRQVKNVKELVSEYENSEDPFIIKSNVKKIQAVNDLNDVYGTDERFFKTPSDLKNSKGKAVVHNFYDRDEKSWVTIINDTLVREGPMPYDHGLIPFSKYTLNKLDDQFYGIGFVDQLESFQALDELGLNMYVESKKIAENPPMIINENIFPSFEEQYTRVAPRQIIRADGSVGEDNLRWFQGPEGSVMDLVSYKNMIVDYGTMSTGINDLSFASSSPNDTPVRNNMQAMQATNEIVKFLISRWALGYKDAIGQMLSELGQKMPQMIEDGYDSVMLDNIKLQDYGDDTISKTNMNGLYSFELKPEHFIFAKDPRVIIDVDALLPMSTNLMIQRSEAIMQPPIIAMLANPQYQSNPLVMALFRDYFKKHGYSSEITGYFQDANNGTDDVQIAQKQNEDIVEGKDVVGKPGMSELHLSTHNNFAFDLMLEVSGTGAKHNKELIDKIMQSGGDPAQVLHNLVLHITTDAMPPLVETGVVEKLGAPPQQPPQNGAGMPPPGAAAPPPGQTPSGMMQVAPQGGGLPPQ